MPLIREFLTFTIKNEHDLGHDLKKKTHFSLPKIYTADGDLSKRWYVYFSFRNPKTGRMKRLGNIYGKVNKYKTKEARLTILTSYRKNLLYLLRQGYNPFADNAELYDQLKRSSATKTSIEKEKEEVISSRVNNAIKKAIQEAIDEKSFTVNTKKETTQKSKKSKEKELSEKEKTSQIQPKEEGISIQKAFDTALDLKEKEVSKGTIRDYRSKILRFITWIQKTYPDKKNIKEITRKDLTAFLNSILLETSPRSRNNYRTELGSLFQVLKNNEMVTENYIPTIPVLKSKPTRHKTYPLKEQEKIFTYLEKEDRDLLLFIKFVSYSFMRPIEVCRLRIKDINLETKTVQFKAKNSPLKTKIIPSILFDELPDLSQLDQEAFLFTPDKIGGYWEANETNRRDHFSKRFRSVVKEHFKLNEDYGIYSFRHTFISKLYRKLREDSAPFEAKSNLMLITGHRSMSALEKYLREIDAELPEDYSKLFK
ncbi:site-specific integrase [Polaribacter litorisediminis]|uniref:tyrosine-type recombinase/integrase n=1 Tax=Polaribacter litorisediminis TaxID=1908341 RepID=UPI001CBDEFA6|nr:site-specific integrase [Polaribacter litorisediminis]UAM98005.1 site-specific integrase [Polaribacter litorisediminis]